VNSVKGLENKVLISMPTGRDGELVAAILERAGIDCEVIDPQLIAAEIENGAGAVLIAEEALHDGMLARIEAAVTKQPVWSDIPLLVFSSSSPSAESLLEALSGRFNATIVERPIRITMLISAVRGALRARQRQYQTRDLLAQLKQADQQKDLFLATLSHELRTPLNSILGWIHILRRRKIGGPEIQHALDVIDRNARAQSEMIADILLVSRVITGKVELAIEPIEITSIIEESIDIIRPSAEAKNIDVRMHTDEYTPVTVEADSERLQQIFLNLLTNAVKFTPENGQIDITMRQRNGSVEVEVRDNGYGIDPRFLPFIFERFRQADNKHTRRVGGLGLGLAIVSHLVELHGGKISADSEGKNRGATFTVSLPVAESNRIITEVPHLLSTNGNGHSENSLKGLKVLIVEDDEDSRDMLSTILRYHGAEVETAPNVPLGFSKFREFRPDVLVSDVGLPEEDGYDLIQRIRRLTEEEGGQTPAVALTGYVSTQDQTQAIRAGYQEHLAKPVDTDKLISVLKFLSRSAGVVNRSVQVNNA
jgi:signal transduction histidine kinase/ActR/RegA family two-component response regulator